MREVLRLRLGEIASTRGIGAKKLEKLVLAVDRARNAIARDVPVGLCHTDRTTGDHVSESMTFPYRVARDAHFVGAKHTPLHDLDERDWRCVAQVVRHHGLEDFMLGRFAPSLRELDRALWDTRIATFTRRPLSELRRLQGCGPVRLQQSICQVLSLAFILTPCPNATTREFQCSPPQSRKRTNGWRSCCLPSPKTYRRCDRFARVSFGRC